MVCFYGPTLTRLDESLTDHQRNQYPLWNWLAYNLSKYIGSGRIPYIPRDNDDSRYAHWFKHVVDTLGETYGDTTPERVFKCIFCCPAEEVAILIYDATSLKDQRGFMESLVPRLKKEDFEEEEDLEKIEEKQNPVEDDILEVISDDDMPDLEEIPDNMPVEIPDEDNYEKDIEIVMDYGKCSREEAIKRLKKHDGDLLLTIYELN